MNKVERYISQIRSCFGRYPSYSGGCLKFFLIIKERFPSIEGYYNEDHVLIKYKNKFYDIDGEYTKDTSHFTSIEDYGKYHIIRSFKGLLNKNEIVLIKKWLR